MSRIRCLWGGFVLAAVAAGVMASPAAASIVVDSQADDGSGCTLRDAVNSARYYTNGGGCSDPDMSWSTIELPAGTYTLAGAPGEDANASGDLDLGAGVAIVGAGAGVTTINGANNDRVFDVVQGGGDVTLTGLRVLDGKGALGGGIQMDYNATDRLWLINTVFESNESPNHGGAVRTTGPLTVQNTTFRDNLAADDGGAIEMSGDVVNQIEGSAFVGNGTAGSSDDNGGAIDAYGSVAFTVSNSTFFGNTAYAGGAVYIDANADAGSNVVGVTAVQNTGGGGGGFLLARRGVTLRRSIVVRNIGDGTPNGCETSDGGSIEEGLAGYNLGDSGTYCGFTAAESDITSDSPGLAPLGDYGGPTSTMALYEGSPAIDAVPGSACDLPEKDQRGVNRPVGGAACDIGAFEGSIPDPNAPRSQPGTPNTAGPAAAAPKRCKKGRKLRRGRCVKKKKK